MNVIPMPQVVHWLNTISMQEYQTPPRPPVAQVCVIQINVPAIDSNALPPNITPSSSPGYLSPAVSGAHVRAERLHHPCLLGGPQHGDQNWEKGGTHGGK